MTNPTVSILTTCYNREQYLGECIESVLNGNYQDFELIIVDDRSTDNSLQIARSYAEKDERIRVYQNEQNLGDYPNRNQAASYARGKYIKYLDADDMHGRFMLDIMVDAMESYPDAGLGLFNRGKTPVWNHKLLTPDQAFQAHYRGEHTIFFRSPLNAIIKKSAFDKIGGFSGKQHVGDFELWHLLASSYNAVVIGNEQAYWREHDDQQSKDNRTDILVPFKYQLLSIELINDDTSPLSKEVKSKLTNSVKRRIARTILYAIKRHNLRAVLTLKKASGMSWPRIFRTAFS